MSAVVNEVRTGVYMDSVELMRIAAVLSQLDGVEDVSLMIGTRANKQILEDAGLLTSEGADAAPADLIIAVCATTSDGAREVLREATRAMDTPTKRSNGTGSGGVPIAADPMSAIRNAPQSNLALISVPGEFAAREAHRALRQGLNVMLFSDNVPLADEIALKQSASREGLIVMGPDCGTALISGVPLGFSNAVPRGEVGIVAASGTGLQEFSVILARAGVGVSHGLGVGGRDLSESVGAMSTLQAIDWLESDAHTKIVVVVSKPPAPAVAQRVLQRLAQCVKPAFACFVGNQPMATEASPAVPVDATVLESALRVLAECNVTPSPREGETARTTPGNGGTILGLFSGGTLCAEAQTVLREAGLQVHSNAPVPGVLGVEGDSAGVHLVLDLGADEFTRGRPHPMIAPELRTERIAEALQDPGVGVLLLDVVLGYGAHENPAGAVCDALRVHRLAGRPVVVASVCGVPGDPQGFEQQCDALRHAGVQLADSTAQAARIALSAV